MRQSVAVVAAMAGAASAQSASALTFYTNGPRMNPSWASKFGLETSTFPPVASIITSNQATTVFALGCPTSVPASAGKCSWATDMATYTIIDSTRHIMHRTNTDPDASMYWTCDYNTIATQITCEMEVSGDVNDNTGGPISGVVFPDKNGNVIVFETAQIVTEGRFGELGCGFGYKSSSARACNSDGTGGKATSAGASVASGSVTASTSASAPTATASQGSGIESSQATRTTSASVTPASTGAAARKGVEAFAGVVLIGAAVLNVW